jgi:hypothetical protein
MKRVSLIIGIIFIIFILWNRLLRVRFPKEIIEIGLQYYTVFVLIMACLFLGLALYQLISLIIIPGRNRIIQKVALILESHPKFDRLVEKFDEYIIRAPELVFSKIYQYVYIRPMLQVLEKLGQSWFYYPKFHIYIYIIGIAIPKLVVGIVFVYDIIIEHHLSLFYKSLFLLVIPLFIRLLLYALEMHAVSSIDYLNQYFIFQLDVEDQNKVRIRYRENIEEDLRQERQNFDMAFCGYQWHRFQRCYNFCNSVHQQKQQYNVYVSLFTHILYSLGFLTYFLLLMGVSETPLHYLLSYPLSFDFSTDLSSVFLLNCSKQFSCKLWTNPYYAWGKKFMHRVPLIVHKLTSTASPKVFVRAKWMSVNHPDTHPQDPQADVNNPIPRHYVMVENYCNNIICGDSACESPCSKIVKKEAVANPTHGEAAGAPGRVIKVSDTDLRGHSKKQNMVVYDTPHTHEDGSEFGQGMKTLRKNPSIVDAIRNARKKKASDDSDKTDLP